MPVIIGPVSGDAARAFVTGASDSLAVLRRTPSLGVPDDIITAFEELVADWTARAADEDTFLWTAEMHVGRVRELASQWASVAAAARTEGDEVLRRVDEAARPFYEALITAVANALAQAEDIDGFAGTFTDAVPAFDQTLPPRHRADGPTRVLVVDDSEDIRLLTTVGLSADRRLSVIGEAGDGLEALERAAELQPDAILLDVAMPRMDGVTAIPLLRERLPNVRIVMYSADDRTRDAALANGADVFITKGTRHEVIAAALRGDAH